MTEVFALKTQRPVAEGGRRLVFLHPDNPAWIIKVMKPDFVRIWHEPLPWRQRQRRYREFFPFFQEVREHLAICAAEGAPPRHLQNLVGFAQTDYGLGLVYEGVFDASGVFAPTLANILERGEYTPEIEAAFHDFRDWLLETPIVVTDLRPQNFVCARDGDGRPYFVLIDGVGEKSVIPIKGLVRWLNRGSKKRHLARLDRRTGGRLAAAPT